MDCTPRHQSWQLECERLATACRENSKQRFTMHSSPGSFLLQWLVGIGTELVIPKVVFQIAMKVQSTMAIVTPFFTWGIAEYLQYILHFREIDNNPPRCYRVGMCRIYKGKGISQSTGILTDEINFGVNPTKYNTCIKSYLSNNNTSYTTNYSVKMNFNNT